MTVTVTVTALAPRTPSRASDDVGTNFVSWMPTGALCNYAEQSGAWWPRTIEVKVTCAIKRDLTLHQKMRLSTSFLRALIVRLADRCEASPERWAVDEFRRPMGERQPKVA